MKTFLLGPTSSRIEAYALILIGTAILSAILGHITSDIPSPSVIFVMGTSTLAFQSALRLIRHQLRQPDDRAFPLIDLAIVILLGTAIALHLAPSQHIPAEAITITVILSIALVTTLVAHALRTHIAAQKPSPRDKT